MDLNKQRLKNRLNLKFEPLKLHPASTKKLTLPSKDYSKEEREGREGREGKERSVLGSSRNRSITQVRLPSLQKRAVRGQEKAEELINMREMRQRIKSIKVLPTIKVESKEPINDTITYLMRNEILNIPKIVAMLQKSQSEEFLYMRVIGIYEFEVCDEQQKGSHYITVSRNGMVREGELTPLDKLIHEYELFSKLRANPFFKYYLAIKFMNKWHKGSRMIKFVENKFRLKKLLFLDNERVLAWRVELRALLLIADKGGHVNSGWVGRVAREIEGNKERVEERLLQVSVKVLEKFQLPISESFELMNKVLSNLLTLNINFEKKIRIEKELELVYKLGLTLEFEQLQAIAFYLIHHIQLLAAKFEDKNALYLSNVLLPLEELDTQHPNYVADKEKILLATVVKEEVNFRMVISEGEAAIEPSVATILAKIKSDIREFVTKVENFNYKIIRVPKFDYVVKNVVKPHEAEQPGSKETNLREYIYSITAYYESMRQLEASAERVAATVQRRLALARPFLALHRHYQQQLANRAFAAYGYEQLSEEMEQVEQHIQACQNKMHDGEYFFLGYLSQLEIKEQIVASLREYKESVLATIPGKVRLNREAFLSNMQKHLEVLRIVVKNADDFIRVYAECSELDEKILLYAADLAEIEKLQELYLRVKKVESASLLEEKGLLNELRMKSKNHKETKESSYLLYKKEVDGARRELVQRVEAIAPHEEYYEPSPAPLALHSRCRDNGLRLGELSQQLKHLNQLEAFFDMKPTLIPKLETLTVKFESLEEIWLIYKEQEAERALYFPANVMKVEALPLIRKYEGYLRKAERYNKDPDYYRLAQHLLEQLPLLLNSLYLVEDLHNPVLRSEDYEELTQLFERERRVGRGSRELTLGEVHAHGLWALREQVLEVSFKSHKEQEIQRQLREYEAWWKGIKLEGEYLEEYPLIVIFGDNDQLRREIEEYSTTLLNIINHKYGAFARRECSHHLRSINQLAALLQLAIDHQDKFLALFPILTSKYAEKQLPSEAKKFAAILHKTMRNVKWLLRPTENLNENTRLLLNNHIKQFDALSKTLAHFLEKKRVKFQRFYFLQDDELLEVLVGIGAENTIFRMFDGIKGWLTDKEGLKYGVEGIGGEHLALRGWAYKHQEPEVVFKSLEDAIRSTLNSIVRAILHGYENELRQLRQLYAGTPWMCVYTVELVLFTKQVEINCFQNGVDLAMQAALIQENIAASVASPQDNANYITLQLFLLHFTEELRREAVASVFDFKWRSFLCYYYERDAVVMKTMGAEHQWGGEYQGLWSLMISTADIRRAHASILASIRHGDGVLLQGPSGTGKTESLKELGRCMAKYCVIFNCSSEVSVRTLQKLLSGLCYTGSWLCLDEINRLSAEIMSVVASQISSIKGAVVQGKEVFSFMGKEMRLRRGVGIFSTMNPIYLQRAQLTESLKAYFRIISVNVPDYEKILEVMLYSLAIASSSLYARKIALLFKNLSIQLSLRAQYDFGLRAMKFFIFNLRLVRTATRHEEEAIIEALCKTFYSRLEPEDRDCFAKIVSDTFGRGLGEKQSSYKVAMMREAPQTGIIVLGPTSCKSRLIGEYVQQLPQERVVEVFNPNSLELKYFLGESVLGRWEQGVVERMARGSFEHPARSYVLVLDCRLKSETIENFNTLLDDSKLLSLANGTRLKVHDNFRVILETPDLEMTSPATITRCNVVYVSQEDVDKHSLIAAQLPLFASPETAEKLREALGRFSHAEIERVMRVCRLLFARRVGEGERLSESEGIGFERCLFYSLQLLGEGERVKGLMHKDNSVTGRKSVFQFALSFAKYREGEFVELEAAPRELRRLTELYIPTLRNRFYEYANARAYENCLPVLWKGERMSGKSTAILLSLEELFRTQPEQKRLLRLAVGPGTSARTLGGLLEERMGKEEREEGKKLVVYVDDVHLSSEEVAELLRFSSEHQRLFSYRAKEVVEMARHVLVADCNHRQGKPFSARFTRHFAELALPPADDLAVRTVFAQLARHTVLQTSTSPDFKATYELELDRVVAFFAEYLRVNNKAYWEAQAEGSLEKQQLQLLGFCELLPLIRNYRVLQEGFCREGADFVGFSFGELRAQEAAHRPSPRQLDFIKLAYQEVFKHRHQGEYDRHLRSATGHPLEVGTLSAVGRPALAPLQWEHFRAHVVAQLSQDYYLSEFMLLEILKVLRVLEWNGGNYYLVGAPGVGRKTLLKISCLLAQKECVEALPSEERRISEWYFALLKSCFEKQRAAAVLLCVDSRQAAPILGYLEKTGNGHPVQELLGSEDCEYAYSEIDEYSEVSYDKYAKPYDEVIADFLLLASRRVQLLLYSEPGAVRAFARSHHYTHQKTLYRLVEEVPAEAVLQVSSQILEQGLQEEADRRGLTSLFLKVYGDLVGLARENQLGQQHHFQYNCFYHFKLLTRFVRNYRALLHTAKDKEDILNRSILKVHEIAHTLERLKAEIREVEPRVREKTARLLEVVPVLEGKKRASQEARVGVLNEKREIESRNAEIEEMVREVEEKIGRAEPLLQEANDSMLTLKRAELSELRNNPNPHPLIRFTLENMLILLGEHESWDNIKKVLSDTSLLSRLKNISPAIGNVVKARRRIEENREWSFENVSKVSYGVRYMVRWINNIIKFYELKHSLEGQRQKVEDYKRELARLEEQQAGKQRQLDLQEEDIRVIEQEYNFNRSELLGLQELVTNNNRKFENAELIKEHLQEQINNWYDSLSRYKAMRSHSEATAIAVTLFLEVHPALHLEEQRRVEQQLAEHLARLAFPHDPAFDVPQYVREAILRPRRAQQQAKREEHRQAFALERLSVEDAGNPRIIQTLHHLEARPILLDPDNQAVGWIERQLAGEGEGRASITKESFLSAAKSVEAALREGQVLVLLIEDQLDQFALELLGARVSEAAGSRLIEYNKNVLQVHPLFRLLLCNRSRNPRLSSKLYIDHPVLNFEITKDLLAGMLLQQLVVLENSEAYGVRKQLELEKRQYERTLAEVEEQIIDCLISSKKTLIDDNEFIHLLAQSQAKRAALRENEADWRQKNSSIKKIYDGYADLTEGIAQIYVSLKHLAKVNPLLSWNSELFLQYFVQAVRLSISTPLFDEEDDELPSARALKKSNFEFDHYSIGLGNSRPTSALSFVSGVTSRVAQEERRDDFEEEHPTSKYAFENLVGLREMQVDEKQLGTMTQERERRVRSKFIEFVKFAFTEEERLIWGLLLCFAHLPPADIKALIATAPKRTRLKDYLDNNELSDKIRNLASRNEKFEEELQRAFAQPNPFARLPELSELESLLLCKLLFPSQFSKLCRVLIRSKGFEEVLSYSESKTAHWFERSDNVHPTLLLMGEDPINRISEYLTEKKYKNVILVPMGEGQNKLAEAVLEKESRRENLVIIHNLQISQNFLAFLAKMLQQFQIKPPHDNFRLVLISTVFEGLNEEITSYCHKYLVEQPMGVKNQMQYLREVNSVALSHPYHKKLEFVLTYLHAVINNLSRYKPYGWNLKYEFHTTDFLNSLTTLKEVAETTLSLQNYECNIDLEEEKAKLSLDEIDFKALRYMIGDIGYIGKLADDIDRAKMTILINQFLNPALFTQQHENALGIKAIKFSSLDNKNVDEMIESINESDSSIFGLHPAIKPVSEHSQTILSKIASIYTQSSSAAVGLQQTYLKPIEPVHHKFEYVNREIAKYNSDIEKVKMEGFSDHLQRSMANGLLLSTITSVSKIFNLKAFSNPREFFISIKKDLAHKNNVIYEKVELVWSLAPKESLTGVFGISSIKLEGGTISEHRLQDGVEQRDLTLYVQAVIRKKEKEAKKLVSIPLYLQEERQGQINSYGDNTNLLVLVKIEAAFPQEFWILRSTAFIAM